MLNYGRGGLLLRFVQMGRTSGMSNSDEDSSVMRLLSKA